MNVHSFQLRSVRLNRASTTVATLIGAALLAASLNIEAQDAGPLVEALVRKGVLTSQEGEEIRAELSKTSSPQSSAGKLKLSDSVKELKLYGDLRLRYQYDSKDFQADPFPAGPGGDGRSLSGSSQRSRWRFRLRLNADFKLAENVFGGVELQTGVSSDSTNETFQNGFRDYPIFISRAYLGWSPSEWLTVTAGKVPNPFYTTELVWDGDINPTGITERIAFHEVGTGPGRGDSTATASMSAKSPWELTLIAGQFIFDDNLEGGGRDPGVIDNDETTDVYLFQTQLVGSYRFSNDVKVTLAPGWLVYNGATAVGLENNNRFQDRIDATGNSIISGATRNLNLLLLPGEVAFKVLGKKTRFLWDFSYNVEGRQRAEDIYHLAEISDSDGSTSPHEASDDYALLAGFQFGENRKHGDWSALASYRRTGIAAVDPNLNDSDFADAELNTQGFKFGLAYSLPNFAVLGVTYQYAWRIRDMRGGEATGGNGISDANEVQILQVDLSLKF